MTKRKHRNSDATELRSRAERLVKATRAKTTPADLPTEKYRQELEIHRLELELQNEELRNARVELEKGLDRYTQLFDFAPIGYAMLSREGTIHAMNHVGAGQLYESRSRLIGRRFGQFISLAERPSFDELLATVAKTDRKETRDFELVGIGGERMAMRITAVSLADTESNILVAFEDITAQKRAEERLLRADAALREADRRKDEFLAVLSHELRTPLSTLLMYSQLLRHGDLDEHRIRTAAESIERAARVQARLIDDLLDVSRIVAGKLTMQVEQFDVAAVARAALDAVAKDAERKKLEIIANFEPHLPTISGDAARIQQAVSNLLTNAVKFTPVGGRISLDVRRIEQRIQIEVADTGFGIDPAFLPHLFERFSQADRSVTRSTGGLGLGLSIARSIVEAHRGTVRAKSAGQSKGSTFTISLPVGTTPKVPALSKSIIPPIASTARIQGKRLLVVEDDDSTRETLTEVLSFAGADVRGADGGAEAMRVLHDFHPHVLVCDIAMPEEDGCALLRRIRAQDKQSHEMRALALTAFAGDEDRARTRAAGFECHLVKPIDIDQLLSAVSELLPREEIRKSNASN